MSSNQQLETDGIVGSLDGLGAADHDQPYRFGRRPRASAPYPFSTREYIRLLLLRGRIQDQTSCPLELHNTDATWRSPSAA